MNPSKSSQSGTKKKVEMGQQDIASMLGDRVKKPRAFTEPPLPPAKRQKAIEQPPAAQSSKSESKEEQPSKHPVQLQKKKWRLEQLIKQDREAKARVQDREPSFVFTSPHIDSKRPSAAAASQTKPPLAIKKVRKVTQKITPRKRFAIDVLDKESDEEIQPSQTERETTPTTVSDSPAGPSGGEALLYDVSSLPRVHGLLLDILAALESAVSLLKTRKTLTTVSAVRDIVKRSTRRDFTIRLLSQLAHIVPEAVAVLPPVTSTKGTRMSDNLLIRLDNCQLRKQEGNKEKSAIQTDSKSVGDSCARTRRSLLHTRLVDHVCEHHTAFLKSRGEEESFKGVWHPDFDPDRDVPELPAPPLYPQIVPKRRRNDKEVKIDEDKQNTEKSAKLGSTDDSTTGCKRKRELSDSDAEIEGNVAKKARQLEESSTTGSTKPGLDEETDSCIPTNLLEKVRARQAKKDVDEANADEERLTNRSILTKLPCTMDTISTIFRSERRIVMGWGQLLEKLVKLHPRKWIKEDISKQLDLIVELSPSWCKKIALKSSRGGYALRIVSEAKFNEARQQVSETKSYKLTSSEQIDQTQK